MSLIKFRKTLHRWHCQLKIFLSTVHGMYLAYNLFTFHNEKYSESWLKMTKHRLSWLVIDRNPNFNLPAGTEYPVLFSTEIPARTEYSAIVSTGTEFFIHKRYF